MRDLMRPGRLRRLARAGLLVLGLLALRPEAQAQLTPGTGTFRCPSIRAGATNLGEACVFEFNPTDFNPVRQGAKVVINGRGGNPCARGYDHLSGATTGSIGGYTAANALCAAGAAGTHICTPDEILATIACGNAHPSSGNAWVANGPPGFTSPAVNDCGGWTTAGTTAYGAFWQFAAAGGTGYGTACNVSLPAACCK